MEKYNCWILFKHVKVVEIVKTIMEINCFLKHDCQKMIQTIKNTNIYFSLFHNPNYDDYIQDKLSKVS